MRFARASVALLVSLLLGFGPNEGPIRMEPLDPGESPPTFVMRGTPKGTARMVFLHGMCGHGLGYAQSFQWNAAQKGTLIAPQGDRPCSGPWAMWSNDIDALDARVVATFRALGQEGPIDDVLLIGYSQGASRAEAMARKWPERYARLILIAAPTVASPRGLSSLRACLMMAGEHDRQDLMKAGMRAMLAAHIPSTFMVLPGATHGQMGTTPEKTMGAAFDWLWANQKSD